MAQLEEEQDVNEEEKAPPSDDQKEKEEERGYIVCDLQMFFNLKQSSPNVFDLRSSDQFKKAHVIGAENIPNALKLKQFVEVLAFPILMYGDADSTSPEILNHLWTLIESKGNGSWSMYVLKTDYQSILNSFPFLCGTAVIGKTYPNLILMNELYLGDGMMAEDKDIMIDLGITHIVQVVKGDFHLDQNVKEKISFLKIDIDDTVMESEKMSKEMESAIQFIDRALTKENKEGNNRVFVHCMAGKSRSSTIVIGYLIKTKGYTLCDAYMHTKRCRSVIEPNRGFLGRLAEFELKVHGASTENELKAALKSKEEKRRMSI